VRAEVVVVAEAVVAEAEVEVAVAEAEVVAEAAEAEVAEVVAAAAVATRQLRPHSLCNPRTRPRRPGAR
jgi:hypothetical protein